MPATRLQLDPAPSGTTVLDGGWWPRTDDPATELPAILDAVGDRHGTVTHLLMRAADWAMPHPRRLSYQGRSIHLGWYTAQPAGLLTMICDFGRGRLDLLVVPPRTATASATTAMAAAADPNDGRRVGPLLSELRATS